jgi:hypothetical protein
LKGGCEKRFRHQASLNAIRKEFIDSEKHKAGTKFESHETYVSPEQLEDQYREDKVVYFKKIIIQTKYFETNQQNITEMAEKENLTKTVDLRFTRKIYAFNARNRAKNPRETTRIFRTEKKAEKNHEQFKEDNHVTDYGKKMDGILKSITGKGKRTNTNIKEVPGDKE